jgi:hypothetical protein
MKLKKNNMIKNNLSQPELTCQTYDFSCEMEITS